MTGSDKINNAYRGVKDWDRDKIILYLKGLPEKISDPTNWNLTRQVNQAFKDAVNGPGAVVNLNGLGAGPDCTRVLGNRDAGELFEALYTRHRNNLTSFTSFRDRLQESLRETKAHFPISENRDGLGPGSMFSRLAMLVPDDPRNSGWLWDLLSQACKMWMDVRLRSLRDGAKYDDDGNALNTGLLKVGWQPAQMGSHLGYINAFIHGADLRFDALMCSLEFGTAWHGHESFDRFLKDLYSHYYGITAENGIWLCKSFVSTAEACHHERFSAVD